MESPYFSVMQVLLPVARTVREAMSASVVVDALKRRPSVAQFSIKASVENYYFLCSRIMS